MTKILFLVPPYVNYESFVHPSFNDGTMVKENGNFRNIVADVPIGLLSLGAYLKKNVPVEIRLIDFNIALHKLRSFTYGSFSEMYRDVLSAKEWADFAPDLVGISTLFTPSYSNMLDVARVARELFPGAFVVAGGGVPTNMYTEIFAGSVCFDALCYGEGEKPLLGLVQAADMRAYAGGHPSWITREKVAGGHLFHHDFIEDLDEIPFLDFGLIDRDDYRINPILSTYPLAKERMHSMPIMTSRGCPHRCCFCASHTVHGRQMRYHSVTRVREDFERFKEDYGARTIVFFDDHFMASKKRFFEIIDAMKELGLTAFFPSSLALYALDRKVLEALKSVGLNQIVLSIESGSNRVLKKVMHKPLDLSTVNRVISDCRELGIDTDANILIGLPGETKEDIEEARAFLKTINATWFRINVATPLVGSEMLATCLEKDYIRGDYVDCDYKRAVVETEDFTAEYIQEKVYALNLELNFVENSDFRLGNFEKALKGFENALRVKDDHAFACYFAAKCCTMLGLEARGRAYREKYREIVARSAFWQDYARRFALAGLE